MTEDVAPLVASSNNKRALIVDDSPTACAVLKRMLRNYQITADSVQSAEAALEYLKLEKPDVIFMDHAMPGMNGLDTLKVLKAHPEYATIPVMMYTARTGEVYLSQARAFGAIDVLPKGVEQTVLEEALQRLRLLPNSSDAETPPTAIATTPPAIISHNTVDGHELRREIERVFRSELRPAMSHQIHDALDEWRHEATLANRRLADLVAQRIGNTVSEAMKPVLAELDWQRVEQQRLTRAAKNRALASAAAVLLLTAAFATTLWSAFSTQNELIADSLQLQSQQLSTSLGNLQTQVNALESVAIADNSNAASDHTRWLQETDGNVIGAWAGISPQGAELMVISRTGYRFTLDSEGAIATRLPALYFLAPGCFGDAFAPVHEGTLVTAAGGEQVWFAPIGAERQSVQAYSMLNDDGLCLPMQGEMMSVRNVQNNDPALTGIKGPRFKIDARMALASEFIAP